MVVVLGPVVENCQGLMNHISSKYPRMGKVTPLLVAPRHLGASVVSLGRC
jgi:hypothetical protein